jgi:IS5 family transposase
VKCENFAKQYVEEPDAPATPTGDSEHANWVQIGIILLRVKIDKSLRKTEAYLNILSVKGFDTLKK